MAPGDAIDVERLQSMSESLQMRRPRAYFTRVLRRICAKLDENSVFEVASPRRGMIPSFKGKIGIRKLSVVGSYARGLPTCGDLDLLLELEVIEGSLPGLPALTRRAFGALPDVRYYHGNQTKNSSGVAFGECVCIWSQRADWAAALVSIREDPHASRPQRRDAVPLRIEQVDSDIHERRHLTELMESGNLRWRLIPYEGGNIPDPLNEMQARVLRIANASWGRKAKALLPDIIKYLLTRVECSLWGESRARLDMAGVLFYVGYSAPPIASLETPQHARIVIAPHVSRRGPNALWEIERGDQHPLEVAFVDREAYVLCDAHGSPSIATEVGDRWNEAAFLELFSSSRAALKWQDYFRSNSDTEDEPIRTPVLYRGRKLLDLLSYADIVEISHGRSKFEALFLTDRAIRVRSSDPGTPITLATLEKLLDGLPRATGKSASRPRQPPKH
jgi:hypothetical protein